MRIITAFAIILFMFSSCHKDALVPEITPSILEKKIELKDEKEIPEKLFLYQSNLIFIQSKNKITRFSPLTDAIEILHTLQHKVNEGFFCQDDRLVFTKAKSKDIIIFNLKTGEVEKIPDGFTGEKIIGLHSNIIIFQSGTQLVLMNVPEGEVIQKIDLEGETVHNCEFENKSLFILTDKKLYIYSLNSGELNCHTLDAEAASGFLLWDNQIYYGSKNRELVRYSLKRKKIVWKIKLPMKLVLRPEKTGRYVIATPEDNNIYFFQKNATLHWWEKCNGTRLSSPVVMRENVAVFLMDKKVKFFDFKNKTVQDYNLKTPAQSNPVYIQDYLYYLSQETRKKGKTYSLIKKLGNQYHVIIKTDPEYVKSAGQSVQFSFTPVNLIKPEMDIKIINPKQETIFSTSFKKNDLPSFIWIPEYEGKYKLVLNVNSQNRKDLNIEKEFTIIDLGKVTNESGRKTIEQCPLGRLN